MHSLLCLVLFSIGFATGSNLHRPLSHPTDRTDASLTSSPTPTRLAVLETASVAHAPVVKHGSCDIAGAFNHSQAVAGPQGAEISCIFSNFKASLASSDCAGGYNDILDQLETEFYLVDPKMGFIMSLGGDRPGPLSPPTTDHESLKMTEMTATNLTAPVYRFEKPSGAPKGYYDLVTMSNGQKKYLGATGGENGEVLFTNASSSGAASQNRIATSIFTVDCRGLITAQLGNSSYSWTGKPSGTKFIQSAADTENILLLRRYAPPTRTLAKRYELLRYSTIRPTVPWTTDSSLQPRCTKNPVVPLVSRPRRIFPLIKTHVKNGCGPEGKIDMVPDLFFKDCCDKHDLCYTDCETSFIDCNEDFRECMMKICPNLLKDPGTVLLAVTCNTMAYGYAEFTYSDFARDMFKKSNEKYCECRPEWTRDRYRRKWREVFDYEFRTGRPRKGSEGKYKYPADNWLKKAW